ncbi:hypothetical protein VNI00_010420 [Paramarasmius palmivorus]|uniref:Nephrocystin 3-like N-terminal domain-containing protein n=1 Tax=Paramarasmius palmivorus TaxID=297713 RepID=A0AAW0CIQ6_9AGAR
MHLLRNLSFRSVKRSSSTSTSSTIRCPDAEQNDSKAIQLLQGNNKVKQAVLNGLVTISRIVDGLAEVIPVPGLKAVTSSLLILAGLYQKYEDNAEHFEDFVQSIARFETLISPLLHPEDDHPMNPRIKEQLEQLSSDLLTYQMEVQRRIEDYQSLLAKIKRILSVHEDARLLIEMTTRLKDAFQAIQFTAIIDTNDKVQQTFDGVDHIIKWASTHDRRRIYWLSGSPGTGKSTIACTVAHTLSGTFNPYFASYFCSRERDLRKLVPTLAVRLRGAKEFRPFLGRVVQKEEGVGFRSIRVQLKKLLIDPLNSLFSHANQPVFLVIDGIDEYPTEDGIDRALLLLEALVELLPEAPFLRVFLSSQGVPKWETILSPDLCLSVNLDDHSGTDEVQKDVLSYFKSLLRQDALHRADEEVAAVMSLVARKANGSFLYAYTMFKLLEQSRDRFFQAVKSPDVAGQDAIIDIYSQLVDKALQRVDDRSLRKRLCKVLLAISCLRSALSLKDVCSLLELDSDAAHLKDFLREFSSILHVDSSTSRLHFVHSSFKDFLQQTSYLHSPLSEPSHHYVIASSLLRYMIKNLRRSPDDSNSSTALEYACLHWAHHLESGARDDSDQRAFKEVWDSILAFTRSEVCLFWMEFVLRRHCMSLVQETLKTVREWTSQNMEDSLGASYHELRKLILAIGTAVDICEPALRASAQQVYETLLCPMTPAQAYIGATYRHVKPSVTLLHTRRQGQRIPLLDPVVTLSVSLDGEHVVIGSSQGDIQIWSTRSAVMVGEIKAYANSTSSTIHDIKFVRPRGIVVVTADRTGGYVNVDAWDFTNGTLPCQVKLLHTEAYGDQVDRGWRLVLSANFVYAAIPVGRLVVWKSATWTEVTSSTVRVSVLLALSSRFFVTDQHVQALEDGQIIRDLVLQSHKLSCASFNYDETLLAVGADDGNIRLYDTTTFDLEFFIENKRPALTFPLSVTFSPDTSIIACSNATCICMWETQSYGKVTKLHLTGENVRLHAVCFSQSGSRFKIVSIENLAIKSLGWYSSGMPIDSQYTTSFAFSPDSRYIAHGFKDGSMGAYGVDDYKLERPVYTHSRPARGVGRICHLVYSPNGRHLAITYENGSTVLTSPFSIAPHWTVMDNDLSRIPIKCITFSGDSNMLALGHTIGEHDSECLYIRIFDVEKRGVSGEMRIPRRISSSGGNCLDLSISGAISLALSRTGSLCAIGGPGFLVVVNQKDGVTSQGSGRGENLFKIKSVAVTAEARSLFFTEDDRYLVSTVGTFWAHNLERVRQNNIPFRRCHLQQDWIIDQDGRRRCWIPRAERYDYGSSCSRMILRERATGNILTLDVAHCVKS